MRSYTRLTASPEDNHHVRNLYGAISTPLNVRQNIFEMWVFLWVFWILKTVNILQFRHINT